MVGAVARCPDDRYQLAAGTEVEPRKVEQVNETRFVVRVIHDHRHTANPNHVQPPDVLLRRVLERRQSLSDLLFVKTEREAGSRGAEGVLNHMAGPATKRDRHTLRLDQVPCHAVAPEAKASVSCD